MIHPTAHIDCEEFTYGPGLTVRAHAEIYGKKVHLGRECFIDEYAVIGGGSAGNLTTGDWLHMGMFSQINTARDVTIGHEVGLGIGTRIFTHGAYLSEWDGFPVSFDGVTIGDRVWLPNAIVNPGVTITSDIVVGAGSVVTRSLECSRSVYAGAPAKFVRAICEPSNQWELLQQICEEAGLGKPIGAVLAGDEHIHCHDTLFMVGKRAILGPVTESTERLRNQLRRHGIRFRYEPTDGGYQPWTS